jgi:hypothetical protein
MKKFAMMGALFGVLAMALSAIGATSASAAEWLCEGKTIATACKVVTENLEALVLEDMGVPSGVECAAGSVTGAGTVGPGVADETTAVTFIAASCKPTAKAENLKGESVANACESVASAPAALDLPWKTEGVSEAAGAEKWDLISEKGTGGQPGYLVECKTKLGTVDDVCKTKEAATSALIELKNLAAEGAEPALVTGVFLKNPLEAKQAAKCSVGGEEDGLVIGEVLFAALNASSALISLEFDTP